MNECVTYQQPAFVQHPDLGDFMKTITTDAIVLQSRGRAMANTTSLEEEVQKLVKQSLPPDSRNFTILPVGPGGRFMDSHRYLVIWCSIFEPHYPSLPQEISRSALDAIYRATGKQGCGLVMHKVTKRARDQVMASSKELEDEQSAELTGNPRSETVLRVIQEVFGGPKAKPHFATSPFSGHTGQNNAKSDTSIEVDTCAGSKEEETTEDGDIEDNGSQRNHDDFQPKAGPKSAVCGSNLSISDDSGIEALRSMMARLATTRKKKGPAVIVKLARPPPSHPTTSVLRPVVSRTPSQELEKPQEKKRISLLEYTSKIGDAEIVHSIYREARTAGTARTEDEERARRKRASRIALKEICDVVDQVEWDRRGRRFQEGPFPSLMEGVDLVPREAQRKWILERREMIRKQRCETRITVWDNTEAAEHIWAVVEAVVICFEAGKEGVMF